jgi:3-dehydroquinate synthase
VERLTIAGVTEVVIDSGLPTPLLPVSPTRRRVVVLTQPGASSYALDIAASLKLEGLKTEVIGLPDRDEAKTLAVAESVYESLIHFGLGRGDTVLAVGGGSVTDLAGFVAGTWLRGVEAVYVPTTLLAAVDASIGGKAGVNLAGKNLVGVFWHPSRVAVDTSLLQKLPRLVLREGMAEALKAGLVGDRRLVEMLAERGVRAPLPEVVSRAVAVKASVVGRDIREHGVRAFLNFGHTIGHAVEFASTLSHGESVAVGTVAACHISRKRLGFGGVEMVESALTDLGLPISVSGLDHARVIDLLRHDKKRDEKGLRMVLLRDVEMPVLDNVDESDIEVGLRAVGL